MTTPDRSHYAREAGHSQSPKTIKIHIPATTREEKSQFRKQDTGLSSKGSEHSPEPDSNSPSPFARNAIRSRKPSEHEIGETHSPFHNDPTPKKKSTFVLNPVQRNPNKLSTLKPETAEPEPLRRVTVWDAQMTDEKKVKQLLRLETTRTPLQGKIIMHYLVEANPFFKNLYEGEEPLDMDSLIFICRNIRYRTFQPGKVIIQEGDEPDGNIFVILSGEAIVVKKKLTFIMEENMKKKLDFRRDKSEKSLIKGLSKIKDSDPKPDLTAQQKVTTVTKTIGALLAIQQRAQTPQTPSEKKKNWIDKRRVKNEFQGLRVSTGSPEQERNSIQRSPLKKNTFGTPLQRTNSKELGSQNPGTPLISSDERRYSRRMTRRDSMFKINSPMPKSKPSLSRKSSLLSMNQSKDEFDRSSGTSIDDEDQDKARLQEKVKEKAAEYGNILDSLFPGSVFGELAVSVGQKRAATILTALKTEVLIMKAEEYHLIRAKNEGKKKKIVEFMLKKFPDLESMGQQVSENLYYALKECKIPYGQHLCFEGEPADSIFLIYSGDVQLSKYLIIEEKPTIGLDSNVSHHLRLRPHYKEEVFVCTIGVGSFCGEECLKKDNVYYYTAKVVSQPGATVYKCDKNKFSLRFPSNTNIGLQNNFEKKQVERFGILKHRLMQKFKDFHINTDHVKEDEDPMKYPIQLKSFGNRSINVKLKMRLFEEPKLELNLGVPQTALSRENHEFLKNRIQKAKANIPELNLPKATLDAIINKPQTERSGRSSPFFSKHASRLPIRAQEMKRVPTDLNRPTPPIENPLDDEHGYFRSLSVKRQYEKQEQIIKKTAHFFVPLNSERTMKDEGKGPIRASEPDENYLERLSASIKKLSDMRNPEHLPLENIDEFKIGIHERSKEEEMRNSYYKKKIRRDLGIDPKAKAKPFQTFKNIDDKLNKVKKKALKSVIDPAIMEVLTGRSSTNEYDGEYDTASNEEIYNFLFLPKGHREGMIKKGRLKSMIPPPPEANTSLTEIITVSGSTKNTQNTYTEPTTISKPPDIGTLSHAERIKLRYKRHVMLKTPRLRSLGDIEALKNKIPLILTDITPHQPPIIAEAIPLFPSRSESLEKK